jgi:hypothetical protein
MFLSMQTHVLESSLLTQEKGMKNGLFIGKIILENIRCMKW